MGITLIVGGRRSGKTHTALKMARAEGKTVGVLAPDDFEAQAFQREHGVEARSIRGWSKSWPTREWDVLLIEDAHKMEVNFVVNALGGLKDRDQPCIMTATDPDTEVGAWLLKFRTAPGVTEIRL